MVICRASKEDEPSVKNKIRTMVDFIREILFEFSAETITSKQRFIEIFGKDDRSLLQQ